MTESLLITPRGLVVDGGKLIPVQYSIEVVPSGIKPYITVMCWSPKDNFPKDLFPNSIAPLPGSRHFRGERISISPEHPLYRYFRCAAFFIRYHMAKIIWWWFGKQAEQDPLNADLWDDRRQPLWPILKNAYRMPDCGQPTAEEIAETRKWNSTCGPSNRNFCGFPDQREIRVHRQKLKRDGLLMIKWFMERFPIQPDAPFVLIEDTRYAAFSAWEYGELRLSVSAADAVLRYYDAVAFEDGDFCITNLAIHYAEDGAPKVRRIHFYLGNRNGCLTEYLRAYGDWFTKKNNRDPDNTIVGQELAALAELLSEYMAPTIIKIEYAPWLQELLALADKSEQEAPQPDISDEEIRECVLSLPHDDESALVAEALIEILAERNRQKALELYKEWNAADDPLPSVEFPEA